MDATTTIRVNPRAASRPASLSHPLTELEKYTRRQTPPG